MAQLSELKKFWKNKKVFVTGHTGFKGSWLIILLKLLGARIYGYSLKPVKKSLFNQIEGKNLLEKNYYADIKNFNNLKATIKSCRPEIIFHLAAQPLVIESFKKPLDTFNTNFIGTAKLLEAVKEKSFIKSVVIITTDKVYKIKGKNNFFTETDELGGNDPYSASKACVEILINSYVFSFFKKTSLKNRVSSARSGNVIGGGDYSKNRLVPDLLKSINSNKELIIRNPEHIRPWQHVIEPLVGYVLLAQKQFSKNINQVPSWNFGPEKNNFISVFKLVYMVKKIISFKTKILKKKSFLETSILKLDNKKSKKILKWKPKWNMKESIEKVIEWNNLNKKKVNARKICEHQIKTYFKEKI